MANTKIPAELSSTPSISDSGDATAITIDSSERVLIGTDSGDSFNADSMLRLQRAGDRVFMQFKTDADQNSGILFGDVDDDVECAIEYEPANKALTFSTGNNNEALRIDSSQKVGIGCTPHFPFDVQLNSSRRIGFNYSDSQNTILSHDGSGNIETLGLRGNTLLFYSDYDASNPDGVERMRINESGNVGIGTTNPLGLLSIKGSGDAIRIESTNSGAGGAQMDMLHFSSSPADGDVHGVINFGGYYTGSSSSYGSTFKSVWTDVSAQQARLEFWTRNGSDYLQRFRIDHLGQLFAFTLTGSSASNPTLKINTSSGFIYYDSSSLRYKENIQDFPNSLNVVKDLRPVTFIDKKLEKSSFGLIAEEVDEIAPELVTYKEIDGKLEPETVVYDKLTIHLLKAIQEQQTIIEDLKARIETLEG